MLTIKVLGSGCTNCHKVEETAKQAVTAMAIDAQVELVTDMQEIMCYGVLQTPGIVIDDKVVSTGRIPALSQMTALIEEFVIRNS